jgi:hypothetical protein
MFALHNMTAGGFPVFPKGSAENTCQSAVLKAVQKYVAGQAKRFAKCVKDELRDGASQSSAIASHCYGTVMSPVSTKVIDTAQKKCNGVFLSVVFPGCQLAFLPETCVDAAAGAIKANATPLGISSPRSMRRSSKASIRPICETRRRCSTTFEVFGRRPERPTSLSPRAHANGVLLAVARVEA